MLFNKFLTLLHLNGEYHYMKYNKMNSICSVNLIDYASSEKLVENTSEIIWKMLRCFNNKKLYNPRSRGINEAFRWFFCNKEEMMRFKEVVMNNYDKREDVIEQYFIEQYGELEEIIDTELKHVRNLLINM